MAFIPRTFDQILTDMINYVKLNTTITDFTVGSVIRTILEAAAIEDDEQYFQMAELIDGYSLNSASGVDLDARVADFGLTRLRPASSVGSVVITDGNLITNSLIFDTLVGSITVSLEDSSSFPTSGYPYTVRIGEGTPSVEDIQVLDNNVAGSILTVPSGLSNNHSLGDRVSLVSGAADVNIAASLLIQVPSAGASAAIKFTTTESGILVNGNYESTTISAKAIVPGSGGNVGVGRVSQFVSAPPFTGALVFNTSIFGGGRDTERDSQLRSRARLHVQTLSSGTRTALEQAVLGVADPVTGQRVVTAKAVTPPSNSEVILYVDDGTGLVPDSVVLASSDVAVAIPSFPPASSLSIDNGDDFPDEGYLIVSPENSSQIELLQYTSINRTIYPNVAALSTPTSREHDLSDELVLVELITASAEAGQKLFRVAKFPIVNGSIRLWINSGSGFSLKVLNTDYYLNRGTGEIQLTGSGAPLGSVLVASYSYYTGLLFEVQRIVNGDPDISELPGVACAGVIVNVAVPSIRRVSVRLSIAAQNGFEEIDLAPLVKEAIELYINSLGIGENVILAEIIERAMGVTGMLNVTVQSPASDVAILEDELPVPADPAGNSLITVI